MMGNIPGTTEIGPFLNVFVSEDQGLLCIDIDVSSTVGTASIQKAVALRPGHVNRQNSHEKLKERRRC